jgi:hypothetical protein
MSITEDLDFRYCTVKVHIVPVIQIIKKKTKREKYIFYSMKYSHICVLMLNVKKMMKDPHNVFDVSKKYYLSMKSIRLFGRKPN